MLAEVDGNPPVFWCGVGSKQRDEGYMERIFHGMEDETLTLLCGGMSKLIENLDMLIESAGAQP